MEGLVDLGKLGGILPKTITQEPRAGNPPWRTIETAAGMLNAIGLDNDGLENFIAKHLPYLGSLGPAIIVSIAGRTADEFIAMAQRLDGLPGIAAIELNISCPTLATASILARTRVLASASSAAYESSPAPQC